MTRDETENRFDYSLGQALKAARHRTGMTMAALAQRAEISQPHLSQMENGKVSPSISTLYRLARALEVTPQDLLPASPASEFVVARAGQVEGIPIADRPGAATARMLLGAPGRSIQVQEISVEGGQYLGDWFDHEGEEFVYVLSGGISIELRGHGAQVLDVGDSAWYPSSIAHRWVAVTSDAVRVLAVSAVSVATHAHAAGHGMA